MRLKDYLHRKNMTEVAFAEQIGVHASAVNRLIPDPGKPPARRPSLEMMERILVATGGEVTPNDFVGPEYVDFLPDPPPGSGCELRRAG